MGKYKEAFHSSQGHNTDSSIYWYDLKKDESFDLDKTGIGDSEWNSYVCFATWLYKRSLFRSLVRMRDPNPDIPADEYCEDLNKNFSVVPNAPKAYYENEYIYAEVDCTKINGALFLGIMNFYRCIGENPNIRFTYGMLKEEVPELNFYQRLVASHCIKRPNGWVGAPHCAVIRQHIHHLKGLSIESLMETWKKNYDLSNSFSEEKSFQVGGIWSTTIWLPLPWGKDPNSYSGLGKHTNGEGFPMSDKTIKYLLDDNPDKSWVTYA